MFTYKWYSKILRSSLLLQVPDLSDSEFLDPSNVFIVVTYLLSYICSWPSLLIKIYVVPTPLEVEISSCPTWEKARHVSDHLGGVFNYFS